MLRIGIPLNARAGTFDGQVASSSDDAEERASGAVNLTSSDLEFVKDGSKVQRAVGMRWINIQIPPGVTITRAYVSFTVKETGSNPADVEFSGEAADNALSFAAQNFNVSSRPRTDARVDWTNIPPWNTVGEEGLDQQTPDLSPLIQEIVSRPGWATGNSIVIIAEPIPDDSNYGPRTAQSHDDSSSSQAPRLHIEYTTPPNFKVAFIGDQGLTRNSRSVLQLIANEGASMVLHLGDFDYKDDPDAWDQQINDILGPDFPYFAVIGNHGGDKWDVAGGYQQKLQERLERLEGIEGGKICDGDLGVKSACNYKGLFFILSGIGSWPAVNERVTSSGDDAEERSSGAVSLTSSALEFMRKGINVQRAVGMRWTDVQIPPGVTITRAYISFTVKETGSNPADVEFSGEATDNALPFAAQNFNVSSRPGTTARVDWTNIPPWNTVGKEGSAQRTPDLSPIIQEIVNRDGWAMGNSIVIIARGIPKDLNYGPRTAVSFDSSTPGQAPFLHIEYYTTDNEYISYIRDQLAQDNSIWRICAWHKDQRLIQVGDKKDETGWGVYEECRKGGAIIATAHDHSYARTLLMTGFGDVPEYEEGTKDTLVLERGKTFAFVSGLGGDSIFSLDPVLINNPWWASIYAADFGALFCTFNVDGQPDIAHCYFKDIGSDGKERDEFDIKSNVQ